MERDKTRISQYATNEGVALAHTLYGAPTDGHIAHSESIGPNVGRATWSTAPYIPPKRRESDSADRQRPLCAEAECKSWPIKDGEYCPGHARLHGALPTCGSCGRAPKGDTGFCYSHQPSEVVDAVPD